MSLLRRYHSFDNLDDGFFAMKNLLDSVERVIIQALHDFQLHSIIHETLT